MPVLAALKRAEARRRQREEEGDTSDAEDEIMSNESAEGTKKAIQEQLAAKKREILSAATQKAATANTKVSLTKQKKTTVKKSKQQQQQQQQQDDDEEDDEEEEDNVSDSDEEGSDEDEDEEQESEPEQTDVQFIEPNNWVERMSLVALKPLPEDIDPEDDPRREEAFVQHALLSVERGIEMLEKSKVLWRRPEDYYAEMFKSDVHMDKIRRAIESTKAAVQERMKRRMIKEQKQFGKQVQADVLRQRAQEKRSMMAKIAEVRKKKTRGGNDERGDKLDELFGDDDDEGGRGGGGGGNRRARHSARGSAFRGKNLRPGGGGGSKRFSGGGGAGKIRPGKSKRR